MCHLNLLLGIFGNIFWILIFLWILVLVFLKIFGLFIQVLHQHLSPGLEDFFAVKPYDFDSFSLVSRLFSTEYDYSTSTNQHICPPAQIRLRSSIASADFPKFSNSSSSASFWATEMLFRWKLLRIQPGIHCCAQTWPIMHGSKTALVSRLGFY